MKKGLHAIKNRKTSFLIMSILVVVFMWASLGAGMTYAWFISGTEFLNNIFQVGTLNIAVDEEEPTDSIIPGECTEFNYSIENTGTKTAYVRAKFDGYWKRHYHYNRATATATSVGSGETISLSSEAYFKYDYTDFEPGVELGDTSEFLGFFANQFLDPVLSEVLSIEINDEPKSDQNGNEHNNWTEYPEGEDPKTVPFSNPRDDGEDICDAYADLFEEQNPPNKPNIDLLPAPDNCELNYFKIDLDQDGIPDTDGGASYRAGMDDIVPEDEESSDFEVTIFKNDDNEKFAYEANFPVYHVFVKGAGGRTGGNLYMYYFEEQLCDDGKGDRQSYSNGVLRDKGLKQPGGGWSHIDFFYCAPKKPGLEIEKQVKDVDGNWVNANTLDDAPLIPADRDNPPEFKFFVKNTGDVKLIVDVEDSALGVIGEDISLDPDESWTSIKSFPDWEDHLDLSTENVTVELCDSMDNDWIPPGKQPLGTYFYHTQPIKGTKSIPLYINVEIDDDDEKYQGAYLTIYPYFEAVQASHPEDMVEHNWPVTIDESGELSLTND